MKEVWFFLIHLFEGGERHDKKMRRLRTPAEYEAGAAEGYRLVDASPQPAIEGAPYLDLTKIDGEVEGFGKDEKLLIVCAKGKRAYMTQNRLKFYGYTNTRVLEGGTTFNEIQNED